MINQITCRKRNLPKFLFRQFSIVDFSLLRKITLEISTFIYLCSFLSCQSQPYLTTQIIPDKQERIFWQHYPDGLSFGLKTIVSPDQQKIELYFLIQSQRWVEWPLPKGSLLLHTRQESFSLPYTLPEKILPRSTLSIPIPKNYPIIDPMNPSQEAIFNKPVVIWVSLQSYQTPQIFLYHMKDALPLVIHSFNLPQNNK